MAHSSEFNSSDKNAMARHHMEKYSFPKIVSSLGKRHRKFQPIRIRLKPRFDTIEESDESEEINVDPHTCSGICSNYAEREDSFNANKENINIFASGYRHNKYSDRSHFSKTDQKIRSVNHKLENVLKPSHSVKPELLPSRENDIHSINQKLKKLSVKPLPTVISKMLPSSKTEQARSGLDGVKKSSNFARSLDFGTRRKTDVRQSSKVTQTTIETSEKEVQTCKIKVETKDVGTVTSRPIYQVLNENAFKPRILIVNGNKYHVLKQIGSGGSSSVYQVFDLINKALKAVKFVKLPMNDETVRAGYINEVKLLQRLQSFDCVVRLFDYEYLSDDGILYMVLERGDTDFSRLIRTVFECKRRLMKSEIIYYWTEMLKAVKCIHDNGIIHSDLKPSNFLLVSGKLKLIDFGIASSVQSDVTSVLKDNAFGTFNYLSPESIRNVCRPDQGDKPLYRIRYRSDVWSLGCILYLLVYGKTPFQHIMNPYLKAAAIQDPRTKISFPYSDNCTDILRYTMRQCLMFDPTMRPTVAELLMIEYM